MFFQNFIQSVLESLRMSIYYAPILIVSITLHEFSHSFTAYKLGDRTSKNLGRLNINPLRHLDPIGSICLLLFGFGWGKPVPVNINNFKKPKLYNAIVAIAGPLTNIALAIVFGILFGLLYYKIKSHYLFTLLYLSVYMNCVLAVFNLMPIPPLDGSRLLTLLLPDKLYFQFLKYENIFHLLLIILLISGILNGLITFLSRGIYGVIDYLIIKNLSTLSL